MNFNSRMYVDLISFSITVSCLHRDEGFALPVSSERPFVQIECQFAEPLQLMIPQAVEELSLTGLPKGRINFSVVVHNSAEF